MKIDFTKKQFETLIQAVEAGSSVYGILGDNVSDEYKNQSNQIGELQKYLLKFFKDFKMEESAEEFMGELMLSEDLCEKFDEAIDDYDDEIFWNELELRLGKRDFFRSMSEAEKVELEKDNWFPERIHGIYKKWGKEFEENGIDRLEIKKK